MPMNTVTAPMKSALDYQDIDIPLQLFFNEKGTDFFIKHEHRIPSFTVNREKLISGCRMKKYHPSMIHRFIAQDFVRRIAVTVADLVSVRSGVMDLSNLALQAMLYRQFSDNVLELVLSSDRLKEWNRKNPKHRIDKEGSLILSWQFERINKGTGKQNKLRVSIAGKNISKIKNRDGFHIKTEGAGKKKSLSDYYLQCGERSSPGFYYLGYLKESCVERNIHFDSFVNHIEEGNYSEALYDL
jgi:hypothetical protein